jgi:hypothetical protein
LRGFKLNINILKIYIMKKLFKAYSEQTIVHTCMKCGNEFERDYFVEPYQCNCCGAKDHPFIAEKITKEVIHFYCPQCNDYFKASEYLNSAIEDEKVRWLANMITHHRHEHITSWNKMWGRNGGSYTSGWYSGDYEEEKSKINERAKRVLMRKHTDFLIEHGICVEHFLKLEGNDESTIALAKKMLKPQSHFIDC